MAVRDELLERESELASLQAGLAGELLVIAGPAGVGKSRLLGEARGMAQAAGSRVVVARGVELEREFPFGIVSQLFEPLLIRADARERERWLDGPAALAEQMLDSRLSDSALARGENGEFAILHSIFWLTANLCQDGPLAVFIDDAHWADVSSLRFLAYLLPRLDSLNLLVVVAMRPDEPGAEQKLLDLLTADPRTKTLRPQPLSVGATASLLEKRLGAPETDFLRACYAATRGNPLLLHELASVLSRAAVAPTKENAAQVSAIGPRALARSVSHRLSTLPRELAEFAGAAALLGEDASLPEVSALADLDPIKGAQAALELERIEILQVSENAVRFVHPLIRAAVYDLLGYAKRQAGHARAARSLAAANASIDRIAGHLLLTQPAADPQVVGWLRQAAAEAIARGSPESAVAYLRRCLAEPPDPATTLDVLTQAGILAQSFDMTVSVGFLRQALDLATDPDRHAEITWYLGTGVIFSEGYQKAEKTFVDAATTLPEGDDQRRILAWLVGAHANGMSSDPANPVFDLEAARRLEPDTSLGSKMLDCALGFLDTCRGDPRGVAQARRGLAGDLVLKASGVLSTMGWYALAFGDADDLLELLDHGVDTARTIGDLNALASVYLYQGVAWWHRGELAEAQQVLVESLQIYEMGMSTAREVAGPWLAEVLMERGQIDEAAAALRRTGLPDPPPLAGMVQFSLAALSHLQRLRGEHERALQTALTYARYLRARNEDNPATFAWRSEAALSLHALGRHEEALDYALQQLPLARAWGTPLIVGHSLRIAGLMTGGPAGQALLEEAIAVLEPSRAKLEYAKALIDLGSSLRRSGRRTTARGHLQAGIELAELCGASPLVARGQDELLTTGIRSAPAAVRGMQSLTPSERRVAEYATSDITNHQIAQQLYVTTKTIEAHLGSIYRKLHITSRDQLRHIVQPR